MTTYTYDPNWWAQIKKDVIKDAFDIEKAVQKTLYGWQETSLPTSHIGFFAKPSEPIKNQQVDPVLSNTVNKIPGKTS